MQFKHQAVNDLAFILQAPLIYQDFAIESHWLADWQQRLIVLDQEPSALISKINQCKSHFLGSYFETLFSFAINHLSSLEVIFEHKQLISPIRTLGEVDALVRSQDGQLHQLEVAIKFYLESSHEPGHWIGPNKKDSFIKKYERAKTHQLQVLALPEARALLNDYQLNGPINTQLLMFGILFNQISKNDDVTLLNANRLKKPLKKEQRINQTAMTGYWITEDILSRLENGFVSAQELFKPHWISDPIEQEVSKEGYLDFKTWKYDIHEKFKRDIRPRQFVIKRQISDLDNTYTRLFVVPRGW